MPYINILKFFDITKKILESCLKILEKLFTKKCLKIQDFIFGFQSQLEFQYFKSHIKITSDSITLICVTYHVHSCQYSSRPSTFELKLENNLLDIPLKVY